jgi:nucleoside-diphosphate-sugar epimerase
MVGATQTILVTGGTGFIGQRFLNSLREQRVTVHAFTRRHLPDWDNITFLTCDLRDERAVSRLPPRTRPYDAVIHLAAALPDSQACLDENLTAVLNLLKVPGVKGAGKMVYASTIDVYGKTDRRTEPLREEEPCTPLTEYGLSKYAGEVLLQGMCRMQAIPLFVLRLSQVYGPGDHRPIKLIPIVLGHVVDRKPVLLFGDGSSARNYLHVDDAVRSVLACLQDVRPGIYNIGARERTTVREVLELIRTLSPIPVTIENRPAPDRPEIFSLLDVTQAREQLGFVCDIPFAKGMQQTVTAFFEGKR